MRYSERMRDQVTYSRQSVLRALLLLTAIPAVTYRVIEALLSSSLSHLLGYFTIQSNLAVIVVVLLGKKAPRSIQLSVASAITVTAIVFQLFLRGFLDLTWVTSVVTHINHGTTTILYLFWFYHMDEQVGLTRKDLAITLIYPVIYCVFAIVENRLTGRARYFFFDLENIGIRGFLLWFTLLAMLFLLAGGLLLLVDRRLQTMGDRTA